jgi:DNA-binding NarL/FixJ family response regulator
MTWTDRLWEQQPGVPVLGRSRLTKEEKAITLAFAQGADNTGAADAAGITIGVFKGTVLPQTQAKLKGFTAPKLVKRGYETGVLVLDYPADPPKGVRELMAKEVPELLEVLLLVADGYNNKEIAERTGTTAAAVRNRVLALARAFAVEYGIGGRTQLASRAYEFGVIEGAQAAPKKSSK